MGRRGLGPLTIALLAGLLVAACEKQARTRNSQGASLISDSELQAEASGLTTASAYRFVNSEQSLSDARKAVTEERWADAIGAAEALLKKQPDQAEALKIVEQARREGPSQRHYTDFAKAAGTNDVPNAMKHYRQIAEVSVYRERAQGELDRLKGMWVDSQEGEARSLVRLGRCDEARRVAKSVAELYADAKPRMDDAAANCRQREPTPVEVAAAKVALPPAPIVPEPPPIVPEPAKPPVAPPAGPMVASLDSRAPEPPKAAPSAPAPVVAAPAPVTPAPPPVPLQPKTIPMSELEPLRIAGDARPSLPGGAKMLAVRDHIPMIAVVVGVCISDKGTPTVVNLKKSSEYNDANEKILADVRSWRFKPYMSGGQAVPVCTALVLQYKIIRD